MNATMVRTGVFGSFSEAACFCYYGLGKDFKTVLGFVRINKMYFVKYL